MNEEQNLNNEESQQMNIPVVRITLPVKAKHKLFGDVVLIGLRLECDSNNNKMYMVKVNREYFWIYDYETDIVGN